MNALQQNERISKLAAVLRTFGAFILMGSALTFLIQRWDAASHLLRYFYFLGFTCVLALSGFFCGIRLKESKGARTFLGLVTLITTVHFCQLGSFVFSVLGDPEMLRQSIPAFLDWRAMSGMDALLAVAVGGTVLSVLVYTGFSALLRPLALPLTLIYMGGNAMLLLPTRDSITIAALVSGLTLLLAFIDRRLLKHESAAATQEGVFVRVILAMPVLMLLLRNVALYPQFLDSALISSAYAALAIFTFAIIPTYLKSSTTKAICQVASLPLASFAWLYFCDGIVGAPPASAVGIAFYALPLAAMLVLMGVFSESGAVPFYRWTAALTAVGSAMSALALYGGTFATLECIALGVITAAYGFDARSRGLFAAGVSLLVISLLYHIDYAMRLYSMSPWLTLGALGVVVVLSASVLERYHQRLFASLRAFRGHFVAEPEPAGLFEVVNKEAQA